MVQDSDDIGYKGGSGGGEEGFEAMEMSRCK